MVTREGCWEPVCRQTEIIVRQLEGACGECQDDVGLRILKETICATYYLRDTICMSNDRDSTGFPSKQQQNIMAKTNTYQHFCPVARSLEVIGEKWSLLIVRDLLRGPRRFTDLAASLKNITPKWLTTRLRALETAGVVARQSEEGRREVWYSLTPAGEDLRHVVAALNEWGIRHELRPPQRDESVSARAMSNSAVGFLGSARIRFDAPRTWQLTFSSGEEFALVYDGLRWTSSAEIQDNPELTIETSPADWAAFLAAADGGRDAALARMTLTGEPRSVAEFMEAFHALAPV